MSTGSYEEFEYLKHTTAGNEIDVDDFNNLNLGIFSFTDHKLHEFDGYCPE